MSLVRPPPAIIRRLKSGMQNPQTNGSSSGRPSMFLTSHINGRSRGNINLLGVSIAGSCFRLSPSPTYSLGTGALATRPIGRGELIHTEKPLVIQREDQIRSAHSIFAAICVHPTALQEAYLGLTNAFHSDDADGATNVDALVGIFDSNCLPLAPVSPCPVSSPYPNASSEQSYGVFLTLSKFNTSCCPNASLTWDEDRHMMAVYSIQPIAIGEEITISYGQPLFAVCAERREYLRRVKGFWCTCPCCTLQGEEERASDRRRAELCRLFKAVPFLGHDAPAGLRAVSRRCSPCHGRGGSNMTSRLRRRLRRFRHSMRRESICIKTHLHTRHINSACSFAGQRPLAAR